MLQGEQILYELNSNEMEGKKMKIKRVAATESLPI